jgi:cytochrome c-type biogenesis protein CcmH
MTRGSRQLYLSLGDPNPDGSIAVRLYYKPLVLLIWLGAVVMVIGGALSLSDRRLRVGAPKPARSKAALSPRSKSPCDGALSHLALLTLPPRRAHRRASPTNAFGSALEARARALSKELRCMVCQNQSIDDSDAPLARDLRILVRERSAGGRQRSQVIDFLVARYGEFVLLSRGFTGTPRCCGLAGGVLLIRAMRVLVSRAAIGADSAPQRRAQELTRRKRAALGILRRGER